MRTGKIARLPVEIRTQLNHRLQSGSSASRLLPWLNDLPAVRAALKEYFHSRPINPQNLSEWTQGGYQDWLQQQSPHDLAHCLSEDTATFTSTHPPLTDALSHWSATRLALRTRRINALQETDPEAADHLLTKLIRDLTTLQQSQTRVLREQRQRDHLTFRESQARQKAEALREQTDADHEAWALHPDNQDRLWQSLCTAYPDDYHNIPNEDEDPADEDDENEEANEDQDDQPGNNRDDQSEEDFDNESEDDTDPHDEDSDQPSTINHQPPTHSSATQSHSSHPERSAGGQAGAAQSKEPEPSQSPSAQPSPSPCHQVTPLPCHSSESPDAQAYIAARLAAMDADLRIIRARIIDPNYDPTPYIPPTRTEIRIQRIHNGQDPDTGEIPPGVRRPIPIPKHLPYPKTEKEAYFQRLRIDPDYPFPKC